MNIAHMKSAVCSSIDKLAPELTRIAKDIHANPEIGFEEHQAVAWLLEPVKRAGFVVQRPVADLETAFVATRQGNSGPTVGLLAEYDALAGIGHGCGHNIVGTTALGAALGLRDAVPDLAGTVKLFGTPAEEGGGGKVLMADRGVFDGLDAALLVHPGDRNSVMRGGIACQRLIVDYHGRSTHASASPEKGASALDALLLLFAGINQLRQFAPDGYRIHGVIRSGGDTPNVIPAFGRAEFMVRARMRRQLVDLRNRVAEIAEAAALATSTRLELDNGPVYAERWESLELSDAYRSNAESLGLTVKPSPSGIGSSDIGNVGEVCPIIHPYTEIATEGTDQHTEEMRIAAGTPQAAQGMLNGAKTMAMTAIDVIYNQTLLSEAKTTWQKERELAAQGKEREVVSVVRH